MPNFANYYKKIIKFLGNPPQSNISLALKSYTSLQSIISVNGNRIIFQGVPDLTFSTWACNAIRLTFFVAIDPHFAKFFFLTTQLRTNLSCRAKTFYHNDNSNKFSWAVATLTPCRGPKTRLEDARVVSQYVSSSPYLWLFVGVVSSIIIAVAISKSHYSEIVVDAATVAWLVKRYKTHKYTAAELDKMRESEQQFQDDFAKENAEHVARLIAEYEASLRDTPVTLCCRTETAANSLGWVVLRNYLPALNNFAAALTLTFWVYFFTLALYLIYKNEKKN